jgi:hypothetical protein
MGPMIGSSPAVTTHRQHAAGDPPRGGRTWTLARDRLVTSIAQPIANMGLATRPTAATAGRRGDDLAEASLRAALDERLLAVRHRYVAPGGRRVMSATATAATTPPAIIPTPAPPATPVRVARAHLGHHAVATRHRVDVGADVRGAAPQRRVAGATGQRLIVIDYRADRAVVERDLREPIERHQACLRIVASRHAQLDRPQVGVALVLLAVDPARRQAGRQQRDRSDRGQRRRHVTELVVGELVRHHERRRVVGRQDLEQPPADVDRAAWCRERGVRRQPHHQG